ncbi:hypothetical protein ACO2RV_14480 [Ancylobacter sp. VNQ12]
MVARACRQAPPAGRSMSGAGRDEKLVTHATRTVARPRRFDYEVTS